MAQIQWLSNQREGNGKGNKLNELTIRSRVQTLEPTPQLALTNCISRSSFLCPRPAPMKTASVVLPFFIACICSIRLQARSDWSEHRLKHQPKGHSKMHTPWTSQLVFTRVLLMGNSAYILPARTPQAADRERTRKIDEGLGQDSLSNLMINKCNQQVKRNCKCATPPVCL